MCLQYILWYGIIGTLLGRKLLRLTRLFRPLGGLGSLLFGISGGKTVLADGKPFGHSEEFVTVRARWPVVGLMLVVFCCVCASRVKFIVYCSIIK